MRHKYKDLEIPYQRRPKKPGKEYHFDVVAFDTETLTNGDIFLLADSLNNYIWRPTLRDCLDFLFNRDHHQKLSFFYNLEFDARGIFKLIPEQKQRELMAYTKTKILLTSGKSGVRGGKSSYLIKYLPKKQLTLGHGKNTACFYDLAQFFMPLSLERASAICLDEHKTTIKNYDFTLESIEKRKDEIIKYCLNDCWLTMMLGKLTQIGYENLGIKEKAYISPAFLSSKYFLRNCKIPTINDFLDPKKKDVLRDYETRRKELLSFVNEVNPKDLKRLYEDVANLNLLIYELKAQAEEDKRIAKNLKIKEGLEKKKVKRRLARATVFPNFDDYLDLYLSKRAKRG